VLLGVGQQTTTAPGTALWKDSEEFRIMLETKVPQAKSGADAMTYANLAQVLPLQAARLGGRPALRNRRHGLYHDLSWQDYHEHVQAAACALVDVGISPGERVGLVGENSIDWLIADLAILAAGAVNVSPHAPLTARQIHYQLHHAEVVWAIASSRQQLDKLLSMRGELPALRGIVVFDAQAATEGVLPWEAFCQHGREQLGRLRAELDRRMAILGPDDLATVMYTSGTTGNPKGVMLTHGNLLSNSLACLEMQPPKPDEVILSWLPFTHIYARTIDHYTNLCGGVTVALADAPDTVVDNLDQVHPMRMACVPRFYEKVLAAVASPDQAETNRRLRRIFGRRIESMSSGGAPLPRPIADAYTAAGLLLLQGYGLTESSPVISFNVNGHNKPGTVGRAIPGVEVKIAPDGEILTRGPHVMKGYWKNPEATADTIRDGWLYTGDLGSLDADGYLSITGRKKELLVLSNGKKVVPSHIEGLLVGEPCIDQAVVLGEGRNFLTALLVPNWANVKDALASEGTTVSGDAATLAAHPAVVDLLTRRCKATLIDLSPMEQVKKFVILTRPFSVENDELTVSLKLRRNVVLDHYADRVEAMYRE
jgi:long-chain acyl-CoA synthetase